MTYIFFGLLILLIALVIKSTLGEPHPILKAAIHILGGLVGLWIFNLMMSIVSVGIPINIFTVILVGVLGFPGVLALVTLQILGI